MTEAKARHPMKSNMLRLNAMRRQLHLALLIALWTLLIYAIIWLLMELANYLVA